MNDISLKSLKNSVFEGNLDVYNNATILGHLNAATIVEKKSKVHRVLDNAPSEEVKQQVSNGTYEDDCLSWVQEVIDQADDGDTILFQKGRYVFIDQGIKTSKSLFFKGEGEAQLDISKKEPGNHINLLSTGPTDYKKSMVDVVAPVPLGASRTIEKEGEGIKVSDASHFLPGGYAHLTSRQGWRADTNDGYGQNIREWFKIKYVDYEENIIYPDHPLMYDYDYTQIYKLTTYEGLLKKIVIDGLTFIGPGENETGRNNTGYYFHRCIEVIVKNCAFYYFSYASIRSWNGIYIHVHNNIFHGRNVAEGGMKQSTAYYGCYLYHTMSVIFSNNHGRYVRRILDTYRSDTRNLVITGNFIFDSIEGIGGHSGEQILMVGNIASQCKFHAFSTRGKHMTIVGNKSECCGGGISCTPGNESDDYPALTLGTCHIANNTLLRCNGAITITGDTEGLMITGNIMSFKKIGIRLLSKRMHRGMQITNNVFQSDVQCKDLRDKEQIGIKIRNPFSNNPKCPYGLIQGNTFENMHFAIKSQGALSAKFPRDNMNGLPEGFDQYIFFSNNIINQIGDTCIYFNNMGFECTWFITGNIFNTKISNIMKIREALVKSYTHSFAQRPILTNNIIDGQLYPYDIMYANDDVDLPSLSFGNTNVYIHTENGRYITNNSDQNSHVETYKVVKSGLCANIDVKNPWGSGTVSWPSQSKTVKNSVSVHWHPKTRLEINGIEVVVQKVNDKEMKNFEVDIVNPGVDIVDGTAYYVVCELEELVVRRPNTKKTLTFLENDGSIGGKIYIESKNLFFEDATGTKYQLNV